MAKPVVITRPLAQASPLAEQVAAIGRNAIVFPLLEIHPLTDPAPLHRVLSDLGSYAMVAFVSPNAVDATLPIIRHWPKDVVIAVMGTGSRVALDQYGINETNATIVSPQNPHRTDSETLLEAMDLPSLKNKRVLILRGETGRELLGDALRSAGADVTQAAAYRRTAPAMDAARCTQLKSLLESGNDWIVTSSEALKILMQSVQELVVAGGVEKGVEKMQQQQIFVPHLRIQETAQMLGFRHITLTGSGDEQLLAAIQSRA